MRGAGRTPRGLRAQQQTSRAAGGANRSVALTTPAKALSKKLTTSASASQKGNRQPKPTRPLHHTPAGCQCHDARARSQDPAGCQSHDASARRQDTKPSRPLPTNKTSSSPPPQRVQTTTRQDRRNVHFKQGRSRTQRLIRHAHPDGETMTGDSGVGFFGLRPSPPPSAIEFKGCQDAGVYGRRPAGAQKQQQLQTIF